MFGPKSWNTLHSPEAFKFTSPICNVVKPKLQWVDDRDRCFLTFDAAGEPQVEGAYIELSEVIAILIAADGSFVGHRDPTYQRRKVIGSRCAWSHEFTPTQRKHAVGVMYLVETRFDCRSKLLSGAVAPFTIGSDRAEQLPIKSTSENHPFLETGLEVRVRGNDLEFAILCNSAVRGDSQRVELSLEFLDAEKQLAATKTTSLNFKSVSSFALADGSMAIERNVAESIRYVALSGRVELRVVDELGPLRLPEGG